MWPWSKKPRKRRRNLELPLYSEEPLCAYVERLEPRSFNGVRLKRKLDRVDGLHYPEEDLLPIVGAEHGAGLYRAKLYFELRKQCYVATFTFRLAGNPLIDGLPIERRS